MKFEQKIKNIDLYYFVKCYYMQTFDTVPSKKLLLEHLKISESMLRSFLELFIDCNYIYRDNGRYKIYKTKKNFKSNFKLKIKDDIYHFYNDQFYINFNKYSILDTEPHININEIDTIEKLIYLLFSISYHNKMCIEPEIYMIDEEM